MQTLPPRKRQKYHTSVKINTSMPYAACRMEEDPSFWLLRLNFPFDKEERGEESGKMSPQTQPQPQAQLLMQPLWDEQGGHQRLVAFFCILRKSATSWSSSDCTKDDWLTSSQPLIYSFWFKSSEFCCVQMFMPFFSHPRRMWLL